MKPFPAKKILIAFIVVLLAAAAAAVVLRKGDNGKGAEATPAEPPAPVDPVNVAVEVVTSRTVEEGFTLPGTLEAWENLTLSLEQSGLITWIGPREGERVSSGQAILRVDTQSLENQLARNRNDLDLAEKQYERANALFQDKLISQREYDAALHAVQAARTSLDSTSLAIAKSTLKSPINGILDRLFVDRGEFGGLGAPAAVVVNVDRLRVLVDVPEKDVSVVRRGQMVQVLPAEVNGGTAAPVEGSVSFVSYTAEEASRTYLARVTVDNREGRMRPGMIVRVRFVRMVLTDAVTIPLYAVVEREGGRFVFLEKDGVALMRPVTLGPVLEGKVVVLEGVARGDRLIVKGQQLLAPSSPVRVTES